MSTLEARIEEWGEDAQFLVVLGHVDRDEFHAACISKLISDNPDLDDGHLDSWLGPPAHRYWRPVTLADCGGNAEELNWKRAEEWHYFTDDPTEEGAEPVTVLETQL